MGLTLRLFGELRLLAENGELIRLTERAGALLAYLALAASPSSRKLLAEFHSESGNEKEQRAALRQALYLIRKLVAEDAVVSDATNNLLLNTDIVEADVLLFRNCLVKGDRSSLEKAVKLHVGPFLEGVKAPSAAYEEWLVARRSEFLEQALDALLKLASLDTVEGRHAGALVFARQALTLDPMCEAAHRQVMSSLAALGQRTSALRHYETVRQRLAEELGVEPEVETTSIYRLLACGRKSGDNAEVDNSPSALTLSLARRRPMLGWLQKAGALLVPLLITGSAFGVYYYHRQAPSNEIPSIAVLPFAGEDGNAPRNELFREELITILSTHPGIRVVSPNKPTAATAERRRHALGVRYVLEGSIQNSPGLFQVSVQLIEAATGEHLWAGLINESGANTPELQERIAYRIYESLVGFTGQIERHEQQLAWRKPTLLLDDKDYVLRGQQLMLQFTETAYAKGVQIYEDGLSRFPDSTKLRLALAFAYRHGVERNWSKRPDEDLGRAWKYANEVALAPQRSRFDRWTSHWIMAKLAQWYKGDFENSVAEAKAALSIAPYDATSRADLAELAANAGETDLAIDWLQESLRRDPKGPEWYRGNLAWAYYLAGRYDDALAELQKMARPRRLLLTVVYMKLGRLDEWKSSLDEFMANNPDYVIADAARWPLTDRLKRRWLDDLRQAGLKDKAQTSSFGLRKAGLPE
jgi:DNA-binding SARP family transcriptional activator/TolB-like protein